MVWAFFAVFDLGLGFLGGGLTGIFGAIGNKLLDIASAFWNAIVGAILFFISWPFEFVVNTILSFVDGFPGLDLPDFGLDWVDFNGDGKCQGTTLSPDGTGCSGSVD